MADLDDGYTRIANELYEALILADFNKNEQKVVHAITRCTYGFNKKVDRIADSQIAERTGLSRQAVSFAKNTLIRMQVLVREGGKIGPNKNLSEWDISECHRKSDTVRETMTKSVRETMTGVSEKPGHTKDIIQKTVKTRDLKPFSSQLADATCDQQSEPAPIVEVVPAETKGRIIPEAATQTPNGKFWGTQEDLTCAEYIHAKVLMVNPTVKSPNWPDWANQIRLMREQDQRTHREICELFKWANQDGFWALNVLCPKSLRKQWDKLTAKRLHPVRPDHGGHTDLTKSMTADELNRRMHEGF